MYSLAGPPARRAFSLGSVLLLTLTVSAATAAQDDAEPVTDDDASAAVTPGKFRTADLPKGQLGQSLSGVIRGGPGYIAVGGGSNDGLDPQAVILVSDDGVRWQSVPLFGEAAHGNVSDITATPFGYIAVGSDRLAPGSTHLTEAAVWRSDEGIIWERVPEQDGFLGSILTDVTLTPEGVVAVGCETDLQCMTGRVWTSADGVDWVMTSELPLALPSSVAHLGEATVTGGVDEVIDYGTGGSVLASSTDGTTWSMTEPLAEPQSGISDITVRDGRFLATSSEWRLEAKRPDSEILTSSDGLTWESVSGDSLKGMSAAAIGSSDGLTVVAGSQGGTKPSIAWSQELGSFEPGTFAKKTKKDVSLNGVTVDEDAGLVLVVGAHAYRPAIWVSQLK